MITSLFYYCEKVFILTNVWMIVKNSLKHHYLKEKIFKDAYYGHAKRVSKDFEIKKYDIIAS